MLARKQKVRWLRLGRRQRRRMSRRTMKPWVLYGLMHRWKRRRKLAPIRRIIFGRRMRAAMLKSWGGEWELRP